MERNSWQVPHPNKQTNTRNQQTSRGPEEGGERRGPGGGGGGGITCGEGKDGVGRVPARARRARRESKKGGSIDGSLAQVGRSVGWFYERSSACFPSPCSASLGWAGCSSGPHFVLNWANSPPLLLRWATFCSQLDHDLSLACRARKDTRAPYRIRT
jgi:hypothetical protein